MRGCPDAELSFDRIGRNPVATLGRWARFGVAEGALDIRGLCTTRDRLASLEAIYWVYSRAITLWSSCKPGASLSGLWGVRPGENRDSGSRFFVRDLLSRFVPGTFALRSSLGKHTPGLGIIVRNLPSALAMESILLVRAWPWCAKPPGRTCGPGGGSAATAFPFRRARGSSRQNSVRARRHRPWPGESESKLVLS